MVFTDLAALTVTGSGGAATEQSASNTALLSGAPTIVDNNGGYLTGATIQITGGTFSSNENSTADDHLGFTGKADHGNHPWHQHHDQLERGDRDPDAERLRHHRQLPGRPWPG